MKTNITLFIFFLFLAALGAQPIIDPPAQLELLGIQPIYAQPIIDESYPQGEIRRHSFTLARSMKSGDQQHVYNAYYQFNPSQQGSMIMKLDGNTGDILWQTGLTPGINDSTYILIQDLRERSDGNIEGFGALIPYDPDRQFNPLFGQAIRLIFDVESGELLDHFYIVAGEPGSTSAGSLGSTWNQFFCFEEDVHYAHTLPVNGNPNRAMRIYQLNGDFGVIGDTTWVAPPDLDFWNFNNTGLLSLNPPLRIETGEHILPVGYDQFPADTAQNELLWIDDDAKIVRRADLTEVMGGASFMTVEPFGTVGYLVEGNYFNIINGNEPESYTSSGVVSKTGEVLGSNPNLKQFDNFMRAGSYAYYNDSTVLCVAADQEGNTLSVLALGLNGERETLGFIVPEDDNTSMIFGDMRLVDGRYQVNARVSRDTIIVNGDGILEQVRLGPWEYFMAFDAAELGAQVVSTQEAIPPTPIVELSPNPTQDVITVRSAQPITGRILVFDQLGQVYRDRDVEGVTEVQFQLGDLSSGAYFLQVQNEGGALLSRKIIKVE